MNPYIGEIRLFAGTFAPIQWFLCNGQELSIQQFPALYSVIGMTYGGNGRTTFRLPDFRGRVPIHQGYGPGLTPRVIGQADGVNTVTLDNDQMPLHAHTLNCQTATATPDSDNPSNAYWANTGRSSSVYSVGALDTPMNPQALSITGGSHPHNNVQPCLGLHFIICYDGLYPIRS